MMPKDQASRNYTDVVSEDLNCKNIEIVLSSSSADDEKWREPPKLASSTFVLLAAC